MPLLPGRLLKYSHFVLIMSMQPMPEASHTHTPSLLSGKNNPVPVRKGRGSSGHYQKIVLPLLGSCGVPIACDPLRSQMASLPCGYPQDLPLTAFSSHSPSGASLSLQRPSAPQRPLPPEVTVSDRILPCTCPCLLSVPVTDTMTKCNVRERFYFGFQSSLR